MLTHFLVWTFAIVTLLMVAINETFMLSLRGFGSDFLAGSEPTVGLRIRSTVPVWVPHKFEFSVGWS
jgi:hypothetical protein